MTTHKEALTLALEALTVAANMAAVHNDSELEYGFQCTARELENAFKEALAQPEQEPRTAEEKLARMKSELAYMRKSQPEPSPEWMTEEEQTAYTFGWFKALESRRMAQPEQKPVAKVCHDLDGHIGWNPKLTQLPDEGTPLYTTPPQRTWVGLTDSEKYALSNDVVQRGVPVFEAICEAEAKLKEKNT